MPIEPTAARILIVDYDVSARIAYEHALERAGFDVRVARSLTDSSAATEGWAPDIILLDLCMPRASDARAVAALRRGGTTARAILVAFRQQISNGDAAHFHDAGFDEWLAKPTNALLLVHQARALLGTGREERVEDNLVTTSFSTRPVQFRMQPPPSRTPTGEPPPARSDCHRSP